MTQYGFEYRIEPENAYDMEIGYGIGVKWFTSEKARDHFQKEFAKAHPGNPIRQVERL